MPPKAKSKTPKKSAKKAPSKRKASKAAAPSGKEQFLQSFIREHATTMKVLRAFPAEQGDFRPHPRSNNARELVWTFVMEQMLISKALSDQFTFGSGGPPKAPPDFRAIVDQFEKDFDPLVAQIKKTSDASLQGTVKFMTGPGQFGDWPKMQFAWFMLSDQIHHRGQLSVYVRMTGGKVPAIYGPSADEPWR